ncbi:MAG: UTP--glucose-1-phosphate uridylyltransferase GalU [Deferribacteraceae bacterium]|jgi:UTP--glucose-1-phosphate uridylyltransferase|nr:UTP--glucose-1-phosphate uridylyltransferase GalU [Deferribacteraceae bacterium]
MKIRKAVFPVAGYGTRMLPATKAIPKEMITLIDKPLIQYSVEEAIDSGIEQIIFITGRAKKSMEDHFDMNVELNKILLESGRTKLYEDMKRISEMADIIYVRQKEQLGLGHAILCAKDILKGEPFAVILPDDIILSKEPVISQLIRQYERVNGNIISLMPIKAEHARRYGIVSIDTRVDERMYKLADMVEKPKDTPLSEFAIIGRYILTPDILNILETTQPETGNEIQLTDALRTLAKNGHVFGYEFDGMRFDCGEKIGLLEATINFAAQNSELAPELRRIMSKLDYKD